MISFIQIDPTVCRNGIITWLAIENTKPITSISMQASSWQNEHRNQIWLGKVIIAIFLGMWMKE